MNIEINSILHYNDEIDQILDYEFSDDSNIFSDTQESMSKQCIFKNKKQVWHSNPISHSTERTSSQSICNNLEYPILLTGCMTVFLHPLCSH